VELRNILNAGVVRFVEGTAEKGLVLGQDVVRALVERYKFWEHPTKASEFELDDGGQGATFQHGAFDGFPVQRLRLYRRGVAAESPGVPSADVCRFIDDLLAFGAKEFGLRYADSSDVKHVFNSSLEIQMSDAFGRKFDVLNRVASEIDAMLVRDGIQAPGFSLGGLILQPDTSAVAPITPGKFIVERRVNYALRDNVYFSQAPLRTDDHLAILESLDRES